MTKKHVSFIQASVPVSRGPAEHFETDSLAMTAFSRPGEVAEIHTPQQTLQRIHEVLHARHSSGKGASVDYPGINRNVAEIVEDCRLHLTKWPWGHGYTPPEIATDIRAALIGEVAAAKKARKNSADKTNPFGVFGTQLRAYAVSNGAGTAHPIYDLKDNESDLISDVVHDIHRGNHRYAAAKLHKLFYFKEDEDKPAAKKKAESLKVKAEPGEFSKDFSEVIGTGMVGDEDRDPVEDILKSYHSHNPKMTIVQLPLVEQTTHTTDGYRMATSGGRMYRPALRRPILPQRLFMKRAPTEPAGAILFDASGSMGVSMKRLLQCCQHSPTAIVAFYSGDGCNGKLYVFAANGMRAREIPKNWPSGNTIDGPALDWLMAQDGPKTFVTDRGFCDADDSHFHLLRLNQFEAAGEVTVYESYGKFSQGFGIPNPEEYDHDDYDDYDDYDD